MEEGGVVYNLYTYTLTTTTTHTYPHAAPSRLISIYLERAITVSDNQNLPDLEARNGDW